MYNYQMLLSMDITKLERHGTLLSGHLFNMIGSLYYYMAVVFLGPKKGSVNENISYLLSHK